MPRLSIIASEPLRSAYSVKRAPTASVKVGSDGEMAVCGEKTGWDVTWQPKCKSQTEKTVENRYQ